MQNKVQANKEHCKHCFDVLIATLKKQNPPAWPSHLPSIPVPLFVTWKVTKNQDLRGCIGTFAKQELSKVLPEYALVSALKDPRFNPVSLDEVPNLSVAVSLLVNFQKRDNIFDWEVGKHGIQIVFGNGLHRGTYLPEVASEQGWNQEQTLKHLVQKAGYNGSWDAVKDEIELTTYQSSKEHMSYEQYKK